MPWLSRPLVHLASPTGRALGGRVSGHRTGYARLRAHDGAARCRRIRPWHHRRRSGRPAGRPGTAQSGVLRARFRGTSGLGHARLGGGPGPRAYPAVGAPNPPATGQTKCGFQLPCLAALHAPGILSGTRPRRARTGRAAKGVPGRAVPCSQRRQPLSGLLGSSGSGKWEAQRVSGRPSDPPLPCRGTGFPSRISTTTRQNSRGRDSPAASIGIGQKIWCRRRTKICTTGPSKYRSPSSPVPPTRSWRCWAATR